MIVIIDYGVGNLRSVQKSIDRSGFKAIISNNIIDIKNSSKLILPGVGNFKHAINKLKSSLFIDEINHQVLEKKTPILGICLGMQLMTKFSDEGNCEGLGWIDANTVKFNCGYKIPHIGWNTNFYVKKNILSEGISKKDEFYFVHSYFVKTNNKNDDLFRSKYGNEFVSGFAKENIFGLQFHPEKSYDAGIKILKNFCNL